LEEIHAGAKRLKNHANAMNNEVTEQNVILQELAQVLTLMTIHLSRY